MFDQLRDDRSEQMSQTMKALHESSRIEPQLFAHPTEGNSMQIMHDGGRGHQLVAVEIFRQDSGGRGLKDTSAMGTIFSGKPIDDGFCLQGVTLQNQPVTQAFIDEQPSATRAMIPYGIVYGNDPIHLRRRGSFTARSSMPRSSPLGFSLFSLSGIGFERKFRRGSRRPEETLLLLSRPIGKLLPKPLNFLSEFIDLSLFLEAFRTRVDQGLSSLRRMTCFWMSETSRVSSLSFR